MACSILWEGTKERERNWSRRKLHIRRGLISNTSMRSANGKTITPPPSLANADYALRHPLKHCADNLFSNFIYKI